MDDSILEGNDGPTVPKYLLEEALRNKIAEASDLAKMKDLLSWAKEYDEITESDSNQFFSMLSEFFSNLLSLDLGKLPYSTIVQASELIAGINENLRRSTAPPVRTSRSSFDPAKFAEIYGNILANEQLLNSVLQPSMPILLLSKFSLQDIDEVNTKIEKLKEVQKEAVVLMRNATLNATNSAQTALDTLNEMVESGKAALAGIGVDKHAADFTKITNDHNTVGNRWLIVSVLATLFAVTMPLLLYWTFPVDGDLNSAQTINRIFVKIVLLAGVFYVVSVCVKNYKINRHLEVVNKHRATALSTFRTFVEAAGDEDTKKQILLESTKTIFAPVSTGYVTDESDNPESRLIQIAAAIRGK